MLQTIEKNLVASYLARLSLVSSDEVDEVLELYQVQQNINFYHVRFDLSGTQCLWDRFFKKINEQIIPYCLDRREVNNKRVDDPETEAKRLFVRNPNTGEPGEIILFFLTEGTLHAPKVLSKMRLKTTPKMPVHGADGVHLGVFDGKLALFFGESKTHQNSKGAISSALSSIKEFIKEGNGKDDSKKDLELRIIRRFVDIPSPVIRSIFLNLLNPYKGQSTSLDEVFVCFIGFNLGDFCVQCKRSAGCMESPCLIDKQLFINQYQAESQRCITEITSIVNQDPILKDQQLVFFFLPFTLLDRFREKFLEGL